MNLQEFLTLYEKGQGGAATSLKKWMSQNGYTPDADLNRSLKNALRTYDRSLPTYGTSAETLGQKHLTNSGFSDYLSEVAESGLSQDKAKAQAVYLETLEDAKKGYASYLTQIGSQAKEAVSSLDEAGVRDYDTAYAYGIANGLSKETASALGTYVTNMGDKPISQTAVRQRMSMLTQMIRLNLPKDVAYQYALSCGVADEVAKELAEAAYAAQHPYTGDKIVY